MASTTVEHELDGTTTEYEDIPVKGDHIERLMTELFTAHWSRLTVGPLLQGAVFEIRFAGAPKVTMLDGYLTADTGAWHLHLCVNDTSGPAAQARRVGRAAFFRSTGSSCAPEVHGLRLWNGLGEQMVTVLFPSAYYDDAMAPLRPPDPSRLVLWEDIRSRYRA
jgi:hypothetical protein